MPCDAPSAMLRAWFDGLSRSKALSSKGSRAFFFFARGKLRHSSVRRCNCETYRSCYAELKCLCSAGSGDPQRRSNVAPPTITCDPCVPSRGDRSTHPRRDLPCHLEKQTLRYTMGISYSEYEGGRARDQLAGQGLLFGSRSGTLLLCFAFAIPRARPGIQYCRNLVTWARSFIAEKTFNAPLSARRVPRSINHGDDQTQGRRLGTGVDGSRRAAATQDSRSRQHDVEARGSGDPHHEGIRARVAHQGPDSARL